MLTSHLWQEAEFKVVADLAIEDFERAAIAGEAKSCAGLRACGFEQRQGHEQVGTLAGGELYDVVIALRRGYRACKQHIPAGCHQTA
jgi:hypothetical protein